MTTQPTTEPQATEPQHRCDRPGCPIDGVAADNRRQSEFYAETPRSEP